MVQEPIKIKKPLVNHIFIERAFVLKDYRAKVFVKANAIHTPIGNRIFAFDKVHAKEELHVRFDKRLELSFVGIGLVTTFLNGIVGDFVEFQTIFSYEGLREGEGVELSRLDE